MASVAGGSDVITRQTGGLLSLGEVERQLMEISVSAGVASDEERIKRFLADGQVAGAIQQEGDLWRVYPQLLKSWEAYLVRKQVSSQKSKKAVEQAGEAVPKTRHQLQQAGYRLADTPGGGLTGTTQLLSAEGQPTEIVRPMKGQGESGDGMPEGRTSPDVKGLLGEQARDPDVTSLKQPSSEASVGAQTVPRPEAPASEVDDDLRLPVDSDFESVQEEIGSTEGAVLAGEEGAGDQPGASPPRTESGESLSDVEIEVASEQLGSPLQTDEGETEAAKNRLATHTGSPGKVATPKEPVIRSDLPTSPAVAPVIDGRMGERGLVTLARGAAATSRGGSRETLSRLSKDNVRGGAEASRANPNRSGRSTTKRRVVRRQRKVHFDAERFEVDAFRRLVNLREEDSVRWGRMSMAARLRSQYELRDWYLVQCSEAEGCFVHSLWPGVVARVEREEERVARLQEGRLRMRHTSGGVDWLHSRSQYQTPISGDFTPKDVAPAHGPDTSEGRRVMEEKQDGLYAAQTLPSRGAGRPGGSGRGSQSSHKPSAEVEHRPVGASTLGSNSQGEEWSFEPVPGQWSQAETNRDRQQPASREGTARATGKLPSNYYMERDGRPSYGSFSRTHHPESTCSTEDEGEDEVHPMSLREDEGAGRTAGPSGLWGAESLGTDPSPKEDKQTRMMKEMMECITQLRGQMRHASVRADAREAEHASELAALRLQSEGEKAEWERRAATERKAFGCNGAPDTLKPPHAKTTGYKYEPGSDTEGQHTGSDVPLHTLPEVQKLIALQNQQHFTPSGVKVLDSPHSMTSVPHTIGLRDVGSQMTYTNVLKLLSTFSGPTSSQTWEEFHTRFERLLEDHGIDRSQWAKLLFAKLVGNAGRVVMQLPVDESRDYVTLVGALDREYTKERTREAAEEQLELRVQKEGETVEEFGKALQELARTAYPDNATMRASVIMKRLSRGLWDDVMISRFKDFRRTTTKCSLGQMLDHLIEHDPLERVKANPDGRALPIRANRTDFRAGIVQAMADYLQSQDGSKPSETPSAGAPVLAITPSQAGSGRGGRNERRRGRGAANAAGTGPPVQCSDKSAAIGDGAEKRIMDAMSSKWAELSQSLDLKMENWLKNIRANEGASSTSGRGAFGSYRGRGWGGQRGGRGGNQNARGRGGGSGGGRQPGAEDVCHSCGRKGHWARECNRNLLACETCYFTVCAGDDCSACRIVDISSQMSSPEGGESASSGN
jgi:hypothetical protein